VRELCRLADIHSKSLLLQIVRQSDAKKMIALIEKLPAQGTTREQARRIVKQQKGKAARGRPRHFVFRYQPREKTFSLSLQFHKAQVPRDEIIRSLQAIIDELLNDAPTA
jgi:ParB family chromosome partitioning protein